MTDAFELPLSLVQALAQRAAQTPERIALRFLADAPGEQAVLSYRELDQRARTIAAALQARAGFGERAVLLFPSGPDYVAAFFGCLYAGVIAVPAYPPESTRQHHQQRLLSIIDDAEPRLLLTVAALEGSLQGLEALSRANAPALLAVDRLDPALAAHWREPALKGDDIAFLQYTSGSTALPKGVQVSHGNLVANEQLIRRGFGIDLNPDDVIVSWLPLYHDMGLIGGLLQPIFSGVPCVLMAPGYFLARPLRWLQAISDYGGTISGGPDFAYRLCSERVSTAALAGLDLSRWRVAYSGSEPIRQDSLATFADKFRACGFDPQSFFASYGLAEATLFISGSRRGQGIAALELDAEAFAANRAEPGQGSVLMSCGYPQPGHALRIVEPQRLQVLGDNQVGEIWASGPSIARGYWRNPQASARTFVEMDGQTWLRTGDLGFMREGEVFVSGRLKDLLIVRGQNLYPQDLEKTLEREVEVLRKGRVAVFAVEQQGEEGIGVAVEVSRNVQKALKPDDLIKTLRQVVADACRQAPAVVLLLNPGALPKTSSGKLQRSACRMRMADGSLDCYARFPGQNPADASPATADALQARIASVWCDILKVQAVAADDHFLLLGGNSIAATQATARLADELGISLNLATLFEAPVLADYSQAVAALLAADGARATAIAPLARARALPQSLAQNRLWLLWQLQPQAAAYNIPAGLHLRGELDEAALEATFQALVQRHESLRTVFSEEHGQALQRILPSAPFHLRRLDLAGQPPDQVIAQREAEACQPFDLTLGPLLRVTLARLGDEDHQLWVTLHHIVADGWSLNILLEEFARLYAAHCQGLQANLAPLPLGYADYASWQRQWLAAGEAERQLHYWQARLGEEAPVLDLCTDQPRTSQRDQRAARLQVQVPAGLAEALRGLAREQQASLFMVLLAGWQALLHRYSGQADIRVGVPNANRPRLETQGLVGFFINTQVMRAQLDGRLPFSQLLAQVSQATLAAQANQDLPFEQLVEAMPEAREQGLFQVMFNHQQRDLSALRRLPGLLVEELPWHSREAKFDLQLHSEEDHQGRLSLAFDYAAGLFEATTIERLAEHLLALLEQVCAAPQRALGEVQLLDEPGRRQLLGWGQAPAVAPQRLLVEQLNDQARQTPQRTALVWQGGSLDYAELHQQANRLAHYLRDKGVGPDTCVAIAVERSPQLLVGLLAILKAGGAYVPLDVDYPAERLAYMLADCGAGLLLSHSGLLGKLPQVDGVSAIALDQLHLDSWPSHAPGLHLHGDNLAYVIYTSGSTGQPKGVGNTHAALAERLQWMQATYALDDSDVLLQKAPVSFDVSVWECFWPLVTGCKLVLAGPGEHRDPQRIAALVQAHGVTTLHFVPPLLQVFVQEPQAQACTSLRRLFSGGEALPAALRDRVLQVLPQAQLHNRYGPTETAINVTHWHCQAADGERSPIGRPLANVLCRVLDDELELTAPGVPGELYLGGAGLARGYLGRPGLTAERFVPRADGHGERLYRSGDRARWQVQSQALEYLGRLDQQVKVRGFRVEPEEVQACLLAQAGVAQALVLVHQDAVGAQLLGYYCGSAQPAELLAVLADRLPAYMVPAQLIPLAQMPLGPNGKVARKALPAPVWQQREHVAPHSALQQQVAAIWCEVLNLPRVGLQDDFFALGGHSLLATQIVSRTRQACDVELPLKVLFDASELGAFCAQIARIRAAGERNLQGEIARVDRRQAVPLSYSQQRMWFLWQMQPDSPAYNVGGMARLRGTLHVEAFERALQALVVRHETLRTTFPSIDGVPYQCVAPDASLHLDWHDFSALSEATRQQRLRQLADDQAHQPFDLEHGPLLRACLVKAAEREHCFVLTLHHIVTEGWAMDIFARELGELYEAFVDDRESPLPPLPVQYLDYSLWQRQWLESGEGARQLAYWQARLGDEHPVLALPADRPRPPVQSHRGKLYRFELAPALVARVHAFNRQRGLTLFMTVTATLAALLHRYSGQRDLRIGAPVANRIRPESEGLIGAFLNTQVLRCEVDGQMTAHALLEQVRQAAIEGQSHQDLPFEQLVEALQPPRSSAYNPLFQVMCNVQRWAFQQSRTLAGMQVDYLVNDASATKFDLYLEVTDLDGRLNCCLTYSRDLFDEPRIARMAEHWQQLLGGLLDDPQQRLCELPMLVSAEQQVLAGQLPGEHGNLDQTLHGLFAAQAARTPHAAALTFAGQHFTYAELDQQANRLARALCERGVGPQVRVGLALERSLHMVVGLLAILKAGGAYVPLDPEYPLDRLRYMIEDSRIGLLLSQRALLQSLGELPAGVVCWSLEDDSASLSAYSAAPLDNRNLAQHPAYLIYTSGSTGKPKGVVVSHGEFAMHCQAVISAFGMRSDDCELHFYSINFDAASERLWVPLLCGARVVLRAQGQWAAEDICQLVREQQVSILGFTPSYGSQLAQYLAGQGEQLPVRLVITGGEALSGEHLQRIRQAFAPQQLFNAYGPTETVVMPLACLAPHTLPAELGSVPIGRVVGSRTAYILDENLALLPQGGIGELYVGGAGLAQGYHDRPGLSAERFVADPFSAAGGRLYRTGDLVRLGSDGLVEYLGRADQQVKLRGFRIELGEIESCLQAHAEVDQAVVLALDLPGGKQLVGYLVCPQAAADSAAQGRLREAVKTHARRHLPDYMVPAQLVLLDRLPLMGNGKLDRRALPLPELEQARQHYQAPGNAVEAQLAQIWCAVLNLARVGVQDNFFELGGDSILSIQVVSRARQAGLQFTPRDLFQHQTIQALAAVVRHSEANSSIDQGLRQGPVGMTPIQHWFFATDLAQPQHWNQAVLLQARQALDEAALEQALAALVRHHDSLRLRFSEANGRWQAAYAQPGAGQLLWSATVADFADCQALYTDLQRSLDLQQGPLLRALLVRDGQGSQRLLLAIHHLVVDGVSWRVLLEDLQALYRGQPLPAKTHTMGDWAARLASYAGSDSLRDELGWWQGQLAGVRRELPCDHPQGGNLQRHARTLAIGLDAQQTRQLLQQAPAAYHTQVNDLLLTALARTLCRWSGDEAVLVQLEGHGRDGLFEDMDLTRSVGWFTNAYPLSLRPLPGEDDAARAASIKCIKEQLRQVPHKGLGYGVLRYLADATVREQMAALPQARITFNYLGQFDQQFDGAALFQPLDAPAGQAHAADAPLPNWLSVDGQVYGGALQLRWTFSAERYDERTIASLAEAYRQELLALVEHCLADGNGSFTPSDFPLAHLTQAQIDTLPVPAAQIEDVYPLTPMQEGMLLHTLLEPGTGLYYMQDRYRINSALDPERFAQAWQAVVARHEALRASFSWNSGEAMLQIIHKPGNTPLDYQDWRDLDEDAQEQRLQALHKQEREAGFALLSEAPFHLRLVRVADERYWFMMSNHHILIDAWCRSLLMNDFFEIYQALGEGRQAQLPVPPRYRDYIGWLQHQGLDDARAWWQASLAGFERATAIPSDRPLRHDHAGSGMVVGDCHTRLAVDDGVRLRELAQAHQLTVNTFAQAAWALVLARYSGDRDVVFGVTVAGRPVSQPQMQRTVGLFINSVALRVQLPAAGQRCSVRQWLQGLLERNMELREYEYLPLVAIQECSELPKGQPLFDSLFVFENAPVETAVLDHAQQLNASSDSGRTHTNFPLTAVCYPGDELGLHLSFDQRYFDYPTVERLLAEFKRLLLALVQGFAGEVSALPLLGAEEQRFLLEDCNRTSRAYPLQQSYIAQFEAQVAAHPQRTVARCLEATYDYAGLNLAANRLGHALVAAGVQVDQPVALLAERGLPLLGMIVGSFKAGAGYLPLDPGLPSARLHSILQLSRAPALVCSAACAGQARQLLEALEAAARPQLLVWEDVQASPLASHNPGIHSAPGNLAYVIYTSGSTGLPKGVMVEQRGMLNNQLSKVPYLALTEHDVIAQTASQSFDISVWQFLAAPLFGARVEIVPNAIAHDPQALLAHVRATGISVLESVPSLIQGMLASDHQALDSLRWMLPTGEAMPPELAAQWLQRYPQIGLVNAYGPAECSDDVAFFRVDAASTHGSYLPIGRPTDNNRLYLFDQELALVPLGAVGELCVAGTGVGRGYVGDPVRTALAFIPHPHGAAGERLYRTGDLARQRPDGVLAYIGRIDHQVKIRGYRIELGEIEARLHEQAEIRDAAVGVQEGVNGKYLVGYLVAHQGISADAALLEQLKQRLRGELPEYMVPLHWGWFASLPRNANGKLDRNALPAIDIAGQHSQAYQAPRNELEALLADIWADVLKAGRVGVHDNFFELGGHSLLATRIASQVQKQLQLNVPLRAMFECSTVAELAEHVQGLQGSALDEDKVDRLSDLMAELEGL
ncbi:non-ribosomal peptide synthetase [Pseudomonas anuradhapurensis]